jgi:hypothetical protein
MPDITVDTEKFWLTAIFVFFIQRKKEKKRCNKLVRQTHGNPFFKSLPNRQAPYDILVSLRLQQVKLFG